MIDEVWEEWIPDPIALSPELDALVQEYQNILGVAADLVADYGHPAVERLVRHAMFRPTSFSRPWPPIDSRPARVIVWAMVWGSALNPSEYVMPQDLDYLCLCKPEDLQDVGWTLSQNVLREDGSYPNGPFESLRYSESREDTRLNINAICSTDVDFVRSCVNAQAFCVEHPPRDKSQRVNVFESFKEWERPNGNTG